MWGANAGYVSLGLLMVVACGGSQATNATSGGADVTAATPTEPTESLEPAPAPRSPQRRVKARLEELIAACNTADDQDASVDAATPFFVDQSHSNVLEVCSQLFDVAIATVDGYSTEDSGSVHVLEVTLVDDDESFTLYARFVDQHEAYHLLATDVVYDRPVGPDEPRMTTAEVEAELQRCWTAMEKYTACLTTAMDGEARRVVLDGMEESRRDWEQDSTTDGGKAALAASCSSYEQVWKTSAEKLGCTW